MRCDKIRRLINRYIDKELIDKKAAALIEGHLQGCSRCRSELDSLNRIKGLISEKQKLTAKEDFLISLKKRLTPAPAAMELKWVVETGDLARRLIPVPVTIMLLVICLMFVRYNGLNPVDDYIFGDLTSKEIAIVDGDIEESDLLDEVLFEGYPSIEG